MSHDGRKNRSEDNETVNQQHTHPMQSVSNNSIHDMKAQPEATIVPAMHMTSPVQQIIQPQMEESLSSQKPAAVVPTSQQLYPGPSMNNPSHQRANVQQVTLPASGQPLVIVINQANQQPASQYSQHSGPVQMVPPTQFYPGLYNTMPPPLMMNQFPQVYQQRQYFQYYLHPGFANNSSGYNYASSTNGIYQNMPSYITLPPPLRIQKESNDLSPDKDVSSSNFNETNTHSVEEKKQENDQISRIQGNNQEAATFVTKNKSVKLSDNEEKNMCPQKSVLCSNGKEPEIMENGVLNAVSQKVFDSDTDISVKEVGVGGEKKQYAATVHGDLSKVLAINLGKKNEEKKKKKRCPLRNENGEITYRKDVKKSTVVRKGNPLQIGPKVFLKYNYEENQWSPLNPEGKKRYGKVFLLQLQFVPLSLCKPKNLPNLNIIKDKPRLDTSPSPTCRGVKTKKDISMKKAIPLPEKHPKSGNKLNSKQNSEIKHRNLEETSISIPAMSGGSSVVDKTSVSYVDGEILDLFSLFNEINESVPLNDITPGEFSGDTPSVIKPDEVENIHLAENKLSFLSKSIISPTNSNEVESIHLEENELELSFLGRSYIEPNFSNDGKTDRSEASGGQPSTPEQGVELESYNVDEKVAEKKEIEKITKVLLDDLLNTHNFEEAMKSVKEMVSPRNIDLFITSAIQLVLAGSSQSRNMLGEFLCSLMKKNVISFDQYKMGFEEIIRFLDECLLDILKISKNMGEILAPYVKEDEASYLQNLKELLKPFLKEGKESPGRSVASCILQCARNSKSKIESGEILNPLELDWSQFLEGDKDETIDNMLNNELRENMLYLLKTSDENEHIFHWIDVRVAVADTSENDFIRVLVTAVLEDAIEITDQSFVLVETRLKKRSKLLNRYINCYKLEMHALQALQILMNKLRHPTDLLNQIFNILYNDNVITEEAFKEWEQNYDDKTEGKDVALYSTRSFLQSLKNLNL